MKPKFITLTAIFSTLMLLATGCVYYPRLTDIPLIREKGDTRIQGGVGLPDLPPSAHASVSHGLTENIAIQIAGNVGSNEHRYAQGAVGFFQNKQDQKIMEIYGGFGYGHGRAEGRYSSKEGALYGNFQIYFAQFNYGRINSGKKANIEYGFGLKLGYLRSRMADSFFYSQYQEEDCTGSTVKVVGQRTN